MVLDTSAVVAMYLEEPGYDRLFQRVQASDIVLIGAPTLFESAMVLTSRTGPQARSVLEAAIRRMGVMIVPFSGDHVHPAALNFGDCMSYAVAKVAGMPLLYSGNDFSQTDITPA
jgi:ribonuclease VapC